MKAREPKAGDRCEHAQYNPLTYRRSRDCQVMHLQGKPPGQLIVRRDQGQSVLVCTKHAEGMALVSVRKQKPRKVDAKQASLEFDAFGIEPVYKPIGAPTLGHFFPGDARPLVSVSTPEPAEYYPDPEAKDADELFPQPKRVPFQSDYWFKSSMPEGE